MYKKYITYADVNVYTMLRNKVLLNNKNIKINFKNVTEKNTLMVSFMLQNKLVPRRLYVNEQIATLVFKTNPHSDAVVICFFES